MLSLAFAACASNEPVTCDSELPRAAPTGSGENVLVVLLDDVGVDKVSGYGLHPDAPATPNIDRLIGQGVRFDRAYAEATCSPTRASLLTGRHPSRTGIGWWIDRDDPPYSLPLEEVTFAEAVAGAGYTSSAVGKWHVSAFQDPGAPLHPNAQGFAHFDGILGNPSMAIGRDDQPRGYTHWERIEDGALAWDDRYLTTAQVDAALDEVETIPEPWVLYVALSAAHQPWESPPAELATPRGSEDPDRYDAVVEAADHELGRLLDSLGAERLARTTVILTGDNGTPMEVVRPPWPAANAKGSLTDGGVRVPLVVTGPHVVEPRATEALAHVVDVFATILDIAGVEAEVDGRSLLPVLEDPAVAGRRCLLVERFYPNGPERGDGSRAVIGRDTKVTRSDGEDEGSAVTADPSAEAAAPVDPDLSAMLDAYERALR